MKRSDRFSLLGFSSDCEVESVAVGRGGRECGGFGWDVNSPHFNYSSVGGKKKFFWRRRLPSEAGNEDMKEKPLSDELSKEAEENLRKGGR